MIGVLHTARINAIEFIVSSDKLIKMVNFSSVDRAPARCSGGHGFDSCRGFRSFLCPTLVSCWLIHLHIRLWVYDLRHSDEKWKIKLIIDTGWQTAQLVPNDFEIARFFYILQDTGHNANEVSVSNIFETKMSYFHVKRENYITW